MTCDQVQGASIISKIDLMSRYHQTRIKDEDIHKTTFRAKYGNYEFVVLPFELINAPKTFMCLMKNVLSLFLANFFIIFIDAILLYSKRKEEHDQHLQIFLHTLRENELYVKFNTCSFYQEKNLIFGACTVKRRDCCRSKKIKTIVEWPIPKDVADVR